MRDFTATPCLLFPELFCRPLTATLDVLNASSDGGAVLLKAADRRLGLIARLGTALVDERQPGKVRRLVLRLPATFRTATAGERSRCAAVRLLATNTNLADLTRHFPQGEALSE